MSRAVLLVVLAAALGSCSLLVDRSNQCRVDEDCFKLFDGHPVCKAGVCVASGLGPAGCFYGEPKDQSQYLNACSVSQCIPYENKKKLNLGPADPFPTEVVPPPKLGDTPALVNMQPTPTVPCMHPTRPNLIYATGSTNLLPLLKAVAPVLNEGEPPYRVIYQPQTSCKGAGSMFEADPTKRIIKDIPNNWAFFYDEAGVKNYCFLQPDGNAVDIGESDVYAQTCGYDTKQGIADYMGPIQAITFVVPSMYSPERSISAEAAHLVFGAGARMGMIEPWTDPTLYFVRSSGTGTIQLTSRAINVPPTSWWGIDRLSSDNLRDSLEAVDPMRASRAIGVLSSDFADKARGTLRVLAFQAQGQTCGYFPDSTNTSLDKANVRDGHYPIWGPIHLYAQLTQATPSRQAQALIRLLTEPRLEQRLMDAVIDSGYIPSCAMRVTRDQEMGPIIPRPLTAFSCGCYYEKYVNARNNCTPCGGPADCPTSRPACNYGFCENN
jgi:ABC-type phosphate transport system substrate-binding protein